MWIKLNAIKFPIAFDGVPALVSILREVLRGWTVTEVKKNRRDAQIRLCAGPRGYERRSPWIEGADALGFIDPVDAVCDLLLDIERAYIVEAKNQLVLHAAGVKIGAGVVVFPSTHATGKSLLSVALAHAGHRIFADDQLPIVPGQPTLGVAPGFLPRLRRPLPDDLNPQLVDFIRHHQGPLSTQFRYVDVPDQGLAPLGERAPIVGLVLLDRVSGAKPKIEAVGEAEVLKACVLQNFGRTLNALEVLDHLHAMVKGVDCVKLTYGTVGEAVALLQEKFA
jgi:hypothetical protein